MTKAELLKLIRHELVATIDDMLNSPHDYGLEKEPVVYEVTEDEIVALLLK